MLEHYTQLSTSEVFFSLEVDELISLLEDDDLHAPSEEYVADSALRSVNTLFVAMLITVSFQLLCGPWRWFPWRCRLILTVE